MVARRSQVDLPRNGLLFSYRQTTIPIPKPAVSERGENVVDQDERFVPLYLPFLSPPVRYRLHNRPDLPRSSCDDLQQQ